MMSNNTVSELFLQQVFHQLPDYFFVKDLNLVYLNSNQHFAELVGLKTPEDIMGKRDEDLPCHADSKITKVLHEGSVDALDGKTTTMKEQTMQLPKNKKIVVSIKQFPVTNHKGHVIGAAGYFYQPIVEEGARPFVNHRQELMVAKLRYEMEPPLSALNLLFNFPPPFMITERDHITVSSALKRIADIINQVEIS